MMKGNKSRKNNTISYEQDKTDLEDSEGLVGKTQWNGFPGYERKLSLKPGDNLGFN